MKATRFATSPDVIGTLLTITATELAAWVTVAVAESIEPASMPATNAAVRARFIENVPPMSCPFLSPGLLGSSLRPHQAAHPPRSVARLAPSQENGRLSDEIHNRAVNI